MVFWAHSQQIQFIYIYFQQPNNSPAIVGLARRTTTTPNIIEQWLNVTCVVHLFCVANEQKHRDIQCSDLFELTSLSVCNVIWLVFMFIHICKIIAFNRIIGWTQFITISSSYFVCFFFNSLADVFKWVFSFFYMCYTPIWYILFNNYLDFSSNMFYKYIYHLSRLISISISVNVNPTNHVPTLCWFKIIPFT